MNFQEAYKFLDSRKKQAEIIIGQEQLFINRN